MKLNTIHPRAGLVVFAGAALLMLAGVANARPVTLEASAPQPPKVRAGWQSNFPFSPTQGANLFFHYTCPTLTPTPVSGTFSTNAAAQTGLELVGTGRRTDGAPADWFWSIDWPSGAPAGAQITFNVYCAKH